MKYLKRIIFLIFSIGFCIGIYAFYWNARVIDLNFVFTSDGHGHVLPSTAYWEKDKPGIGGLAAVGSFLAKMKRPFLLTDSGDIFQGTPEGVLTKGKIVVNLMNLLGYDAIAIGNHEFDLGQDVLRSLSALADFPMLGANITENDTNSVPGYAKEYILKVLRNIKIGIIGVITPDMENLVIKENIQGIDFLEPIEVINSKTKLLKENGAQIVLILSHLGLDRNKKIASHLKDVDIILSGHSHQSLESPIKIDRLLICHPGSNFVNIGHLKLFFSTAENKIISYSHRLIPLYTETYTGHPEVEKILDEMLIDFSREMAAKIGSAKVDLYHHLYGKQKKHGELPIGNLQTDIMREAADCDLAFQNTGGIRASLLKGDIKVRDVWELSPFGNTLVKMTLTGKQVRRLLEHSAAQDYSKLQVSGLKVIYNSSLPKGRRVLNILVIDDSGEIEKLEPEKEYEIVTNSFLAQGGDGYIIFKEGEDIQETAILLRDLEMEYIKKNSPIYARIEERLLNVSIEKLSD